MMKFMYFLMDKEEVHQKRLELELEVAELQNTLEKEQKLNQILHCSLQGRLVCQSCLSSFVPLQVQVLLAELAMVEEEIIYLERKLDDLKLCFSRERKQGKERRQKHNFFCGLGVRKEIKTDQELPLVPNSFDSFSERSDSCSNLIDEELERPRSSKSSSKMNVYIESPNKLSEEIIKLLINIFHKLNKKTELLEHRPNSKNDAIKDKGYSMKFVNFMRDSFDISCIALCIPDIRKLREMIQRLSFVDLSSMTYKQKLAFWINVYNSCIMHAFLHHGLPQSPDKLLGLLKKATVNIGGVILNALAIEHFILRHSSYDHTNYGILEEKKGFVLDNYDLDYPEPNITFALCRGSKSSPALRVYTAEDVANELEIAKVYYLETSVKVTGKRKIIIPKLLYWHMRDFADNTESLIEWIYSQLPSNGSLKRVIKELLSGGNPKLILKTVEIEPYNSDFCYLLPV